MRFRRIRKSKLCTVCQNKIGRCWIEEGAVCVKYMPPDNTNFIKMEGVVETPPHVDSDIFCQQFINWIESLGYIACVGISPYEDDNKTAE